ncbi:carboxylesterase 5A-like [Carassius carassius]|uniref:carboxylesterase 5A-like n=1 Tax=Carassius carassius TaxID=217509 RepID=UPI002868CF69|nr:carboxylesterase 5A-like [Carassius carassius]
MIKEVLLCLCLTLAPVWTAPVQTDSGPVVVLKHGSVRGQYMKVKGSEKVVEQYLGIPFAQPPVGPLRLAAPVPVQGWEGIRNATQHPNICLQNPDILPIVAKSMALDFTPTGVSEDCLYLNVYTPSQRSESDKLPVMVWIHGGALVNGGACTFDGSSLAAYENIVVVIIQYRLGILGYFSTGDKNSQGNWGFLDQIAALKWVQQNIEGFGGDPQSVTIAGQSAGGISASFLTLSPMTKGLFQRAIFQSGVATMMGYSVKDPLMHAKAVANVTECDFSSNEVLTKCIKELTEEQIIHATRKKHIFPGATVDGEFLKAQPEELLKRKDFHKVPILVGTTNHEFGWMIFQALFSKDLLKGMDKKTVKQLMEIFTKNGTQGVNEIIAEKYLKHAQTPEDIRDAFTEMIGDIFLVIPSITVASYHRDAGVPVYMYEFQHPPSIFKDLRPSFVKADHGDELGFVFGACFWDGHIKVGTPTEEENQLCRTVMGYWANFIRTGSPNGPSLVHWPVYDKTNKYMNLDLQQNAGQDLKMDKLLFFTEELPKKIVELHKA